jgi:tetratricopeptide (TPR) repeat protein
MVYGFINGFRKDLRASLEPLLTAQCVGHQTGDLEYASVAASLYFINAVESGHCLHVILKEALRYRSRMISSGQKTILRITEPHLEFVRRLIGAPGEEFDFDNAVKEATQRGAMKGEHTTRLCSRYVANYIPPGPHALSSFFVCSVILALHFWRMRLAFLFHDYELAAEQLASVERLATQINTSHSRIGAELIGGLTRAVLIRQGKNRLKNMRRLKQSIACFRKWVVFAPDQISAKLFLLQAELESVRGNSQKAMEYYTNSILIAKGSEIVCDLALASEQAARHFWALGDVRSFAHHMRAACDAYQTWGASAKVAQLKAEIDAALVCRRHATIFEELHTMQSLYFQCS